jgi:hypothetical protein
MTILLISSGQFGQSKACGEVNYLVADVLILIMRVSRRRK